ncbi:MAG: energy-coupling factor transporter transmembrane component T family protein [Bacilli bacterium]|jgi:energy-coupling factor transport system permease protein
MFNSIICGKYYPIQSSIHNLNPISKIICTLLFLITLLFINNYWLFGLLLAFIIILIIIARIPITLIINSILGLKWLIIFIFIFDYLVTKNITLAVSSSSRIILIVVYTSILTMTTKPKDITYALEQLLWPLKLFKISTEQLALIISLAIQFIPNVIEQANKILKSQASRGIDFKYSNIRGKILALTTMLVPLFILSFKRADDLADAMEIRLYGYDKTRTHYRLNQWTTYDNNIVVLHMMILIIFILSEVVWL